MEPLVLLNQDSVNETSSPCYFFIFLENNLHASSLYNRA